MTKKLALLRGINVGGKNIIRMADLRSCFERMGYSEVETYIQSGNVVFLASERSEEKIARKIDTTLSRRFGYESKTLVLSEAKLQGVVKGAPKGFGSRPETYRYDVLFPMKPLTVAKAMEEIETKKGVDEIHAGRGAIYFSRSIKKASSSRLSRLTQKPIYKMLTVRNWNTVTKLLAMMGDASEKSRKKKKS